MLAVYLAAGAALGVVAGVVGRLGIPEGAGVGLVTGVLVGTIPLLNHLVRTGRAPWLVRDEQ